MARKTILHHARSAPAANHADDGRFPPAYLTSVSLENVRCFGPRQTLNLLGPDGRPARWTVIFGNNGVGKTTVLQSIAMLQPFVVGSVMVTDLEKGKSKKPFYLTAPGGGKTSGVLGELWSPHRTGTTEPSRISGGMISGDLLSNSHRTSKLEPVELKFDLGIWTPQLDKRILFPVAQPVSQDLGGLQIYGYGAARQMTGSSLADTEPNEPTATLFSDDASLINAEEWLLRLDYSALKKSPVQPQAARQLEIVKGVLVDLLPDVDSIRIAPPSSPERSATVLFATPYGEVSLHDLSLGYKTLIAWMVDLASRLFTRYPDSPNPLAEPAIVLVDEIDLHLHPMWQKRLFPYLSERFPNTQFIATAHSPLVALSAEDANIALLRREGDHVVIENNMRFVRGLRVDQVLTSELFGLESARSPEVERMQERRRNLLQKERLSATERKELAELEQSVSQLPIGETPEQIRDAEFLTRLAQSIRKTQSAGK